MNKSSSSANWSKVATFLLPIMAVVAVGFFIVIQWNRLHTLQAQQQKTEHDIVFLDNLFLQMKARPAMSKVAVVPPALDEQSQFLDMIRKFADQNQIHLVRYTHRIVAPSAADSTEAKKSGIPLGVLPIASEVEVSGNYNGIRHFMYQLLHSPRLYNTTDLKWSRESNGEKWPITHLNFTLLRYVSTPIIPPKPTGDSANPPSANS